MGISTPGIGSGLDVNGIVSKLMAVEARPLTELDKKTSTYQAQLSAYGTLSGSLSSFQSALSTLASPSAFQSVSSQSNDTSVLVGSATTQAVAGNYKIDVSQIAQAQTLASTGQASVNASIGAGTATVVTFQLGTISGGKFGLAGSGLSAAVVNGGISAGSLSLNGTSIETSSSTKSAKLLAEAINSKTSTTGVTASVSGAKSSATLFGGAGAGSFGDVDTSGAGTYSLTVGGVSIASQLSGVAAGAGVTAASIDATLAGSNSVTSALAAADISFTGSAANGDLVFTAADGSNLSITEAISGSVNGGIGLSSASANSGSSVTTAGSITVASATAAPITVGGSTPSLAGLTAGTGGAYLGASYAQDGTQLSGSLTIDSSNNTLSGIRDAINKAAIGVTATIISDGSATPNHLVLTSTKTGANAGIKISVSGSGGNPADAAIESLLAYDASGTQNLKQNLAAQSTTLNVNGIPVSSTSTTVAGAIQGVTLTIGKVGSATLSVAQDNKSVTSNVGNFVKAYNDLSKAIKDLSGYDAENKKGGPLLGDSTVQTIQAAVRKALTTSISGSSGSLTTLSQIGISFQKDGSLSTDSTKLAAALNKNFNDISSLFAAIGKPTDTLVNYTSATAKTKAGSYALNISKLATQASFTSDAALGGTTVIAADTTWNVTLNDSVPASASNTATITVPQGSYSATDLATLIQSAINGASAFSSNGTTVAAEIDSNGKLAVKTSKYGSTTNITLGSLTGTAVADIFGAVNGVAGVDVEGSLAGSLLTGSGQFLTGAAGSDADGLKIEITGGATGDRGTVNFSQGYAHQLNSLVGTYLGSSGFITGRTNGINTSIKDIAKQKDDFNDKLVAIEARYRKQYTALDTSIASLTTTASFLTQQFAALSKQTS